MASNSNVQAYYLLQPSFGTGEISAEVANRVDLDKYQFALTKAKNCLIRPYGPVYKRPGTVFCSATKYGNRKSILLDFANGDTHFAIELGHKYLRVHKEGIYLGVELATSYNEEDLEDIEFTQSADMMFIASGKYPLKTLTRITDSNWVFGDYEITKPYFDETLGGGSENCTITPAAVSGTTTLTASEAIFTSNMAGQYVQLTQEVPSQTLSHKEEAAATFRSSSIWVGENWKVTTHGTWKGKVGLEYSDDNSTWKEYRSYSANKDYNATESGSFIEGMYVRIFIETTEGDVSVDFTALPYKKTGSAKISNISNAGKTATVQVVEKFGTTEPTRKWSFSAWGGEFGYPRTVAFFQDRLCLGGSKAQPYVIWMSRTGDYNNFSVEKVNGTVTDDSAVMLSLISRKQFEIRHLVPSTDLIVYTEGNEWIISGNEVITPSHCTPKMQDSRGSGKVAPIMIGSKTVFVQNRGSVVRDMGYSYEIDKYGGVDLTLLAKHIIRDKKIIDAAYMQEPDSAIYFVRDDGTIAVLAYVVDQKIYAWSTIETDGQFEAIVSIPEGDIDVLYVVVKRNVNGQITRTIERFNADIHSVDPDDYVAVDSAVIFESDTAVNTFNAPNLAGKTISIVGDTRAYYNIVVAANGNFTIPVKCKHVVAGLPYTMDVELPNVEIKTGDGTMQGRKKIISNVMLRLENSLGGFVGSTFNMQDEIVYEEFQAIERVDLFSGDKEIVLPIGGFNNEGRVAITNSNPYPFNILACVREVTFGG